MSTSHSSRRMRSARARTGSAPAMPAARSSIFPARSKRNLARGALGLDRARARRNVATGVAAGSVRGGASRGRDLGVAPAARAQGRRDSKRSVATVFQPASEQGQKGMDELHQQTVNLLSFQPLAERCVRYAGCIQHGGALRARSRSCRSSRSEARVRRHYQRSRGLTPRNRLQ
jgi:hypothetical protein